MVKRKVPMETEQLDDELLAVVKEIEHGLESVEQSSPVYTPDLAWFENMVVEEKQKLRKKLIFDIALFSVVAVLILSVVLFTLYNVPVIFFTIQGLVTIIFIAYFTFRYIKQVKEA